MTAYTGTFVADTTPDQSGKRTMLASLVAIAVIIGLTLGFVYNQADRAMPILQSFLSDNRLGAASIELRILGAVFAPSFVGLLLIFFALGLPDESKQ